MLLCHEPFNLRPWEVAQLTDAQILHIYNASKDDRGNVRFQDEPPTEKRSHRELLAFYLGITESQLDDPKPSG